MLGMVGDVILHERTTIASQLSSCVSRRRVGGCYVYGEGRKGLVLYL